MNTTIVADLHTHSTCSDGEYRPGELIERAKAIGLEIIALTDHDTIDGLNEARQAGRKVGLRVIPGVEVTLRFNRSYFVGSLHLLIYFKPDLLDDKVFKAAMAEVLSQGRGIPLVRARLEAINREFGPAGRQPLLSTPLTEEELLKFGSNISRRHFSLALKERAEITTADQVNTILSNDSPAYIPSGNDMKTVIPLLGKFPFIRIFAHPAAGSFPGKSHYKEVLPPLEVVEQLLPEFLDPDKLAVQGLEVIYPGHTAEHQALLRDWCRGHALIYTGGSDCHEKEASEHTDGSYRPLGITGLTREEVQPFLNMYDGL